MADLNLGIGIIAEMKDFEKKLATIPEIGAREARDMVSGIRRELRNAEKAAQSTAKGMGGGFSAEFNKITSGAAAMAAGVGGPFGKIAGLANSALKPITEVGLGLEGAAGALGVVGGAAAAAVLSVTAVVAVTKQLADGAVSAEASLDKLGIAFSQDARDDIDTYKDSTADLGIAINQLEVALGADIAGELAHVADAAAGSIRAFLDLKDSVSGVTDELEEFQLIGRAMSDILLGGLILEGARAWEDWGAAVNQSAIAVDGLTEKQLAEKQALQDEKEAQAAVLEGTRQQAMADKAAAEAKTQLAAREAELIRLAEWRANADRIFRESAEADAAAIAKFNADADAVFFEAHDREMAARKAGFDHQKQWVAAYVAQVEKGDDELADSAEATAKARSAAFNATFVDVTQSTLGSLESINQTVIDTYQSQVNAGKKLSSAEVQRANGAIRNQEMVSLAQAGISATLAGIGTYTALVSEFVPPPAAAVAAGAVTSLSFAAAAAGIEAHKPSFFSYPGSGSTSHYDGRDSSDLVDTDGDGKADTAAAVAGKGGHVDTDADRSRNGGGADVRVTFDAKAQRLVQRGRRRPGKRDPRGGR